jgi:hypothetical protein
MPVEDLGHLGRFDAVVAALVEVVVEVLDGVAQSGPVSSDVRASRVSFSR